MKTYRIRVGEDEFTFVHMPKAKYADWSLFSVDGGPMKFNSSITPYALSRALENDGQQDLELDLSGASFVEPAGLVGLATLVEKASQGGRNVRFTAPQDTSVANYLSRMRLPETLDSFGVAHELPQVNANALESELLELSRFEDQSTGEALAELVFNKLKDINAEPAVLEGFYEAICEVTGNVYFHAQVDHGYAAAQTTHGGTKVRFAIADAGIGMKASLRRKHTINDDAHALSMAVQPFVSGTGDPQRGQGLSSVVTNTTELRGSLDLMSGSAKATFRNGGTVYPSVNTAPFPGTLIQVELDCHPQV